MRRQIPQQPIFTTDTAGHVDPDSLHYDLSEVRSALNAVVGDATYLDVVGRTTDPDQPTDGAIRIFSKQSGGVWRLFYRNAEGTTYGPL